MIVLHSYTFNRYTDLDYLKSIQSWCVSNFGVVSYSKDMYRWHYSHRTFFFKQESDLIVFSLKWSN